MERAGTCVGRRPKRGPSQRPCDCAMIRETNAWRLFVFVHCRPGIGGLDICQLLSSAFLCRRSDGNIDKGQGSILSAHSHGHATGRPELLPITACRGKETVIAPPVVVAKINGGDNSKRSRRKSYSTALTISRASEGKAAAKNPWTLRDAGPAG